MYTHSTRHYVVNVQFQYLLVMFVNEAVNIKILGNNSSSYHTFNVKYFITYSRRYRLGIMKY